MAEPTGTTARRLKSQLQPTIDAAADTAAPPDPISTDFLQNPTSEIEMGTGRTPMASALEYLAHPRVQAAMDALEKATSGTGIPPVVLGGRAARLAAKAPEGLEALRQAPAWAAGAAGIIKPMSKKALEGVASLYSFGSPYVKKALSLVDRSTTPVYVDTRLHPPIANLAGATHGFRQDIGPLVAKAKQGPGEELGILAERFREGGPIESAYRYANPDIPYPGSVYVTLDPTLSAEQMGLTTGHELGSHALAMLLGKQAQAERHMNAQELTKLQTILDEHAINMREPPNRLAYRYTVDPKGRGLHEEVAAQMNEAQMFGRQQAGAFRPEERIRVPARSTVKAYPSGAGAMEGRLRTSPQVSWRLRSDEPIHPWMEGFSPESSAPVPGDFLRAFLLHSNLPADLANLPVRPPKR